MLAAERGEFFQSRRPESGPSAEPPTPMRDALDRLESAVRAIHDSDSFRRFLDAQARFHRYSWGNVLLILDQRPDATRVASLRTWNSRGRHVRRGERGIRIFVPVWPRREREEESEGEERDATSAPAH